MNKGIIVLSILQLSCFSFSYGRQQEPILKGDVYLSILNGTVDGEFSLVDIPSIRNYAILLNTGMNIRYIRNQQEGYNYTYNRNYQDTVSEESFYYTLTGRNEQPVKELLISYTGKFPVIKDTLTASERGDWKGNMAFNGSTVRADGYQANWYPVLVDLDNGKRYEKVKYDITIHCQDCKALYVSGNDPVHATVAHFSQKEPTEVMLFCGNYDFDSKRETNFLNPNISVVQMQQFAEIVDTYKQYYSRQLHIPYRSRITFVNTTPVSKRDAWLFVSYPTIVIIGRGEYGLRGYVEEKTADRLKPFIAHELGHYYFNQAFNSALGDMIAESFSEYLSLQVTTDLLGHTRYQQLIDKKLKEVTTLRAIPIGSIKSKQDYQNRNWYVYTYGPVILTAIEKEIGRDKMWQWMRIMLQTKSALTDYSFLDRTLRLAVKDNKKVDILKEKYFMSDHSVYNAVTTIKDKLM